MTTTINKKTATERSRVIVTSGPCECHPVQSTHAHHCDFPELHAEGENASSAGANLENLLLRARDNVSGYRREVIDKALSEVKEFFGRKL
jgi:hypothetical protein